MPKTNEELLRIAEEEFDALRGNRAEAAVALILARYNARMLASAEASEARYQALLSESQQTSADPFYETQEQVEETDEQTDRGGLPSDFPARNSLIAAGISTRTQVEAMTDEDLDAVPGIGPYMTEKIRAALDTKE